MSKLDRMAGSVRKCRFECIVADRVAPSSAGRRRVARENVKRFQRTLFASIFLEIRISRSLAGSVAACLLFGQVQVRQKYCRIQQTCLHQPRAHAAKSLCSRARVVVEFEGCVPTATINKLISVHAIIFIISRESQPHILQMHYTNVHNLDKIKV